MMCFTHADLTPLQAVQLQHVLQTVWTRLQFPETLQMDMAIKYSRHQFAAKLSLVSSLQYQTHFLAFLLPLLFTPVNFSQFEDVVSS